ncbi:MAG: porin [Methylovulum sp.]|nr:porin [Methylovulum sp.]
MLNKQTLWLAIGTVTATGFSNTASAMSVEERMAAMERKMAAMETQLKYTEAENQQLKAYLAQQHKPAQAVDVKPLEDKLSVISQRLDTDKKAADELAKKAPKIEVSNKGVAFKSADEQYKLNLRGYVQADSNFYVDDAVVTPAEMDKFTIRRARLTFDGTLFKNVDFRISPDFGGGQVRLFDAFIDLHYFTGASLMVGKFRQPVSLERMQTATNLTFVERAYPAQLAPNRDVGVMLHGVFAYPGYKAQYTPQPVFKEFFGYEVGVFNGVRDNQAVQNSDTEKDNNKEIAARLFSHPFSHSGTALEGLGIGVAGTWGQPQGNALNSLVSAGQQTILAYSNTATSSGEQYRIYPQMYWYWKSFGMMGEYLLSSQNLYSVGFNKHAVQNNEAWHINMSYMLTGENNSFFAIKPNNRFDPSAGTWGAFQVAARWSELNIDAVTFQNIGTQANPYSFASLSNSVKNAQSWALGVNWFLNDNLKLMTDYEETLFVGGAAGKADRTTEQAVFSRFQVAF